MHPPTERHRVMKQTAIQRHKEQGFVLALAIFMLAICTMIGIAAMMTTTTEVDIATNEAVYRQVLYGAEAGATVAIEALLLREVQGTYDDGEVLDSDNSVVVVDGNFLIEGSDADTNKQWNYWEKYAAAPSDKKNDYKPLDDLRVSGSNPTHPFVTDTDPDIIIRAENQFIINIDVDKVGTRYIGGSGAEFGTGAEGMAGAGYKIIYNIDSISTVPGRNMQDSNAPHAEVLLGYRFVP